MKLDDIEGVDHLATKDDLRVLAAELRAEMAGIRTEIFGLKAALIQWMIGMQLTFATIILGAVYAMLSHFKP